MAYIYASRRKTNNMAKKNTRKVNFFEKYPKNSIIDRVLAQLKLWHKIDKGDKPKKSKKHKKTKKTEQNKDDKGGEV